MSQQIIYISYYTENSPYEEIMNTHLLPSLKKFNLPYDIEAVADLGSWHKNTSYKSQFVFNMLLKHKKTVVFIDADATIEQYPILFERIPSACDIAFHYLDWYKQWRNKDGMNKFELLSGTMMFRYNNKVLELVKKWIEQTETSSQWEQKILQSIIENDKEIKYYILPASYTTVIDHKNKIPDYIENPVIIHHQKSRKFRNRRNWKNG